VDNGEIVARTLDVVRRGQVQRTLRGDRGLLTSRGVVIVIDCGESCLRPAESADHAAVTRGGSIQLDPLGRPELGAGRRQTRRPERWVQSPTCCVLSQFEKAVSVRRSDRERKRGKFSCTRGTRDWRWPQSCAAALSPYPDGASAVHRLTNGPRFRNAVDGPKVGRFPTEKY
jgi:hypothetical protein